MAKGTFGPRSLDTAAALFLENKKKNRRPPFGKGGDRICGDAKRSGRFARFSTGGLALAEGGNRPGHDADRKEPKIHDGGGLSDFFSQHGWQIKVDGAPIVQPHEDEEEQNDHEEECFQDLNQIHNSVAREMAARSCLTTLRPLKQPACQINWS